MIYGRIGDNTEGHKGERNTQGESVATKRSVIEKNGDRHGCTKGCKCEQFQPCWTQQHYWKEVFAFRILTDSCGYKQSRIMTSMLKAKKIGKTLVKRKNGLIRQGLSLYFV